MNRKIIAVLLAIGAIAVVIRAQRTPTKLNGLDTAPAVAPTSPPATAQESKPQPSPTVETPPPAPQPETPQERLTPEPTPTLPFKCRDGSAPTITSRDENGIHYKCGETEGVYLKW